MRIHNKHQQAREVQQATRTTTHRANESVVTRVHLQGGSHNIHVSQLQFSIRFSGITTGVTFFVCVSKRNKAENMCFEYQDLEQQQ